MANIGFISLGCAKNQVDCERMMYRVQEAGHTVKADIVGADVVVINTCGFIDSAKAEAIDFILQTAALKQDGLVGKILVAGCLSQRYQDEIMQEMPEVDGVLGTGSYTEVVPAIVALLEDKSVVEFGSIDAPEQETGRILTTPEHYAFLKIAEGCDNRCAYCAIPDIRGKFRSRPMEELIEEARELDELGVKELTIIAQDTTRYGEDLYGEPKLAELLSELCKIDGIEWIRTLYTYPDRITDKLLDTMANEDKLVNYLDIPLQHCNGEILRNMNRRGDRASLTSLIAKIRAKMPDITLRTTFITGFPGETEAQFTELCEFVEEIGFDRLGCFAYSAEEGTVAADMEGQVEDETKLRRAEIIMDIQSRKIERKNAEHIGSVKQVLVEGYDGYIKCFFGRSRGDAPEIDAKVFFCTDGIKLNEGDIVNVEITDTIEYDLLGLLTE